MLLCILVKRSCWYLRESISNKGQNREMTSVRNSPADTKVGEKGGGGGDAGADSPAACGQAYSKADIHTAAHGGPCGRTWTCPEGTAPVESPCCQFFLRDFSTWEKPTLEHEWERRLRSWYGLTTTTPHHLGHGGGRGGENEGVKQPWKKGVRSRCFSCCLCVSPFSSIVNEIHSILFSQNPFGP